MGEKAIVAVDNGKKVIKIMCHSSRQSAKAFQLLSLAQLLFELRLGSLSLLAFRNIPHRGDDRWRTIKVEEMRVDLHRNASSVLRNVCSLPNQLALGKNPPRKGWHIGMPFGSGNIKDSHSQQFFSCIAKIAAGVVVHFKEQAGQSVISDLLNEDRIRAAVEDNAVIALRLGDGFVCLLNRRLRTLAFGDVVKHGDKVLRLRTVNRDGEPNVQWSDIGFKLLGLTG